MPNTNVATEKMPQVRQMPEYIGSGASSPHSIYAADSSKVNKYAIVSIVLAVVGLFLSMCAGLLGLLAVIPSVVLAIVSFNQIKKTRERGREFIIASVVVNLVSIIIAISAFVLLLIFLPGQEIPQSRY